MKCILKYHEFEAVMEISDAELDKLSETRRFIFAAQPHGVMSVVGICYAVYYAPKRIPPTAVASVLLKVPILKHVFGTFHLVDASRRSLTKVLKRDSVVVYVGGIAELFLSSATEERLYAARKGFVKLALQTGSDVIPLFFFGNTTALEV
ncbi:unnamed protein product [Phaeothamnion confervicola]